MTEEPWIKVWKRKSHSIYAVPVGHNKVTSLYVAQKADKSGPVMEMSNRLLPQMDVIYLLRIYGHTFTENMHKLWKQCITTSIIYERMWKENLGVCLQYWNTSKTWNT